jgi:GT2 family glycosyltransferase
VALIGCGHIDVGQYEETRDVDWVGGCAMLMRSTVIQQVGLLHAEYFAYFEETDWCAQCRRAGYRVVCAPKAHLKHKRKVAVGHLDKFRVYYVTRNRYLFMRRNAGRLQLSFFMFLSIFRSGLLTPVTLLVRQRQPQLLPTYYRAACDGLRIAITGRGGGSNQMSTYPPPEAIPQGKSRIGN